jgi:hypothetical protein
MKIVREHILEFERGADPRETLRVGKEGLAYKIIREFDLPEDFFRVTHEQRKDRNYYRYLSGGDNKRILRNWYKVGGDDKRAVEFIFDKFGKDGIEYIGWLSEPQTQEAYRAGFIDILLDLDLVWENKLLRPWNFKWLRDKLGEKEFDKNLWKEFSPNQIFSIALKLRGYTHLGGKNLEIEYYKKAVKKGATNITNRNNTAFHSACIGGDLELVNILLKDKRIDPSCNAHDGIANRRDEFEYAIRQSAKAGHADIVERLMKDKRVDPSYRGNFALNWAIKGGHDDVVKLLLRDKRVRDDIDLLPKKQRELVKPFLNK